MKCHSLSVFCVALWSSTSVMDVMSPRCFSRYNLRRNSSEMENEVIHTSDCPICPTAQSIRSATCRVSEKRNCE